MINRSIISPEDNESLSFINTSYNLSTSIKESKDEFSLKSIKNITFVPRSGAHNDFRTKEEVFLYVISGVLSYKDSLNNEFNVEMDNMVYLNGGDGMSYDIFNKGPDYLDILEITTTLGDDTFNKKSMCKEPISFISPLKNAPKNNWRYRVSSKYGLAPIKSFCDLNIYSLTLSSNETIDFEVKKDRTAFLLQGYGSSILKTHTTDEVFDLQGSDGLKICSESFTITNELDSTFVLIEGPTL